jgi:hypothetical protein
VRRERAVKRFSFEPMTKSEIEVGRSRIAGAVVSVRTTRSHTMTRPLFMPKLRLGCGEDRSTVGGMLSTDISSQGGMVAIPRGAPWAVRKADNATIIRKQ